MKLKVVSLLITCLWLCLAQTSKAQDAVFSQFFNTTLYLNPALAGIEDDFIVNMNHRTQWNSLDFPYTTSQVSLLMPYYSSKHSKPYGHVGGIGLSVYNDIAGENKSFRTTGVNATAAYNLPFDHDFVNQITFGLQLGMINKNIDTSKLQWGEQYSPFVGFDSSISASEVGNFQNRTFIDVNSGIFWWYNPIDNQSNLINSINSGISIAHLNNPNESVLSAKKSHLPLLYKYHGSVIFNVGKNATVSANVLIAFQKSTAQQNIGSYLSYKINNGAESYFKGTIIRFGAWVRIEDSAILLTEMETSAFKFAFSYDMNTSSLRYNNRGIGTYEIHIGLKFTQHAHPKSRY
jgi:type IX secretion system PorP/SprF family membrane protein